METLEERIDAEFDNNELLQLPFCVLFNFFAEAAAGQLLTHGSMDGRLPAPLTYIFEKVEDFRPMSLEAARAPIFSIDPLAMRSLMSCANLNIAFPFLHSGVYKLEPLGERSWNLDYKTPEVGEIEVQDEVLTRLCIPAVHHKKPSKPIDFAMSVARRVRRGEPLQVLKSRKYLQEVYQNFGTAYRESPLVPDTFFERLGFSSADAYRDVRRALCAIAEAYITASRVIAEVVKADDIVNPEEVYELFRGINMVAIDRVELKSVVTSLAGTPADDFEKYAEFFFSTGPGDNGFSRAFLPPFWDLAGTVYFSPCLAISSLSTRNLLTAIMSDAHLATKYEFSTQISRLFEPALLSRAKQHFLDNGYLVYLEKKIPGSEADLLAYCNRTNTVLVVQAKATLYPEGARMVRNLEKRITDEAVVQVSAFENLKSEDQARIVKECFQDCGPSPTIIHAVLVNSSFGSYKSWTLLRQRSILPLNCNILKNVLPLCKGLPDLPAQIDAYIGKVVSLAKPVLNDKAFNLESGDIIYQKNWDTDDFAIASNLGRFAGE